MAYVGGRSPGLDSLEDLREELLRTKRSHSLVTRENSVIRTRLKVAERDAKQKAEQLEEVLANKTTMSKAEERIRVNSLRRRVVSYEKALRAKNAEIVNLLSDRNTAKTAETRAMLDKLDEECARLRYHLSQSIPESEFLREKQQYMDIINSLTEENMELRKLIGQYETSQRARRGYYSDAAISDTEIMKQMSNSARSKKREMEFYKSSLNNLKKEKLGHASRIPVMASASAHSKLPLMPRARSMKSRVTTGIASKKNAHLARSKSTSASSDRPSARLIQPTVALPTLPATEERYVERGFELPIQHRVKRPVMYRNLSSSSLSSFRRTSFTTAAAQRFDEANAPPLPPNVPRVDYPNTNGNHPASEFSTPSQSEADSFFVGESRSPGVEHTEDEEPVQDAPVMTSEDEERHLQRTLDFLRTYRLRSNMVHVRKNDL